MLPSGKLNENGDNEPELLGTSGATTHARPNMA